MREVEIIEKKRVIPVVSFMFVESPKDGKQYLILTYADGYELKEEVTEELYKSFTRHYVGII